MHTLEQLRSGHLSGLQRLDLSCGLTEFPPEIFQLADTLEVLNLSGNLLQDLPDDLHRLHRLQVLFCSDNRFTHLPAAVGGCTQLLKLMLSGNRLQALPDSLLACRSLELLRIAANHFTALPVWLPQLTRLAWLACGGNPFTEPDSSESDPLVDWQDLVLQEVLGEGTSGVIHRASWQRAPGEEPHAVAVKLFKGQGRMTSDGLPRSEMAACLRAGGHAHVIGAMGRLGGHPGGVPGLVMPLVDPAFQVLAGPPSLVSCTRDVHDTGVRLPLTVVRQLALGVAQAVAHLHGRGILHGDLYAHNILWRGEGEALVGDFGAAALMPRHDPVACESMQRMEVLAFACLLEELLSRADPSGAPPALGQELRALQQRCAHPQPSSRPLFGEIVAGLREGARSPAMHSD